MEPGPWAKLQAQIDSAAIECIYHVINAQTVILILIQYFCPFGKDHSIVLIDMPILLLVHVSKSGLGHNLQPPMVQFGSVNTFPELVVRDERHQLREYSISDIHILCYLIYETVQKYKIKSEILYSRN